jgi:hypothetical protein
VLSDGWGVAPHLLREGVVHDGNVGRAGGVLPGDVPAAQQACVGSRKVARRHLKHVWRQRGVVEFEIGGARPEDRNPMHSARERRMAHDAYGGHTGNASRGVHD